MELVSKEEFIDWMNHPVTQSIRQGIMNLVTVRKEALAERCGIDSGQDREERGYIRGMQESWDHKAMVPDLFPEEESRSES